jgi:hypothetical protein
LTPGSGDGKKSRARIWDEHPSFIFENFLSVFELKILKFFDADPGSGILPNLGLGSGMAKIGSRILDPGCLSRIRNPGFGMFNPDPQH